jgi:hypothetical protein
MKPSYNGSLRQWRLSLLRNQRRWLGNGHFCTVLARAAGDPNHAEKQQIPVRLDFMAVDHIGRCS